MAYDGEDLVGSFPNDFHYPEPGDTSAIGAGNLGVSRPNGAAPLQAIKPRILLMGLRRSGKSSIQKVKL